jgi:hypothetical protein
MPLCLQQQTHLLKHIGWLVRCDVNTYAGNAAVLSRLERNRVTHTHLQFRFRCAGE